MSRFNGYLISALRPDSWAHEGMWRVTVEDPDGHVLTFHPKWTNYRWTALRLGRKIARLHSKGLPLPQFDNGERVTRYRP